MNQGQGVLPVRALPHTNFSSTRRYCEEAVSTRPQARALSGFAAFVIPAELS